VAAVGLEMGVSVAVGLAVGYFLDKEFGTEPYLTLLFLLFGVAAGFKALLRVARQAKSRAGESDR
jgi:ATP synthase protein I